MYINLLEVINYKENSLQNRDVLRSIMLKLYPACTLEMNVLLDIYESGIPELLRKNDDLTEERYRFFIRKVIDEYGIREDLAKDGLDSWVKVCLKGKKAMSEIDIGTDTDYEVKRLSANTIEITKYLGFNEKRKLIIPKEIKGYRVISIGSHAFEYCSNIHRVIIPESVEYIGEYAFYKCEKLKNVSLPTTLKHIGMSAFQYTSLKEVELPDSITRIEEDTFSGCSNLIKIQLPECLEEVGKDAFEECIRLDNVILPIAVNRIGERAFYGCKKLSRIELNEGLKEIESYAFMGCLGLKEIMIPKTVELVDAGAFSKKDYYNSLDIVLKCYPKSKAIEYARRNGLKIEKAE